MATPAPAASKNPLRCLRYPSMRLWSAAHAVSNVGTWMQMVAQNLLVFELTRSVALVGLCASVQALPGLLLALPGGALVDRFPRKPIVIAGQISLAVLALGVAMLSLSGVLAVWHLLVIAALTGAVAALDGPAVAVLGNELVRDEDLASAIALGSIITSFGRVVGTAAAGAAVTAFGPAGGYVANGLSFLLVAAVVPLVKPIRTAGAGPRTKVRLRDGLQVVWQVRQLRVLAVVVLTTGLLCGYWSVTLTELYGSRPGLYATATTCLAVGAVVGAALSGRLRGPTAVTVLKLAAAVAALQVLAAAASGSFVLLCAVLVVSALFAGVQSTAASTLAQTAGPREALGRTVGAFALTGTITGLVAPVALGLALQHLGARPVLAGAGLLALTLLTGIAVLARRTAPTPSAGALPV